MNVYFIPGLAANCKVFKYITLPEGFEKKYIEWFKPKGNETLSEYTHKMAESIDTSKPFILVGYSFGGVIVQEMNKFLTPEKTILIASIKQESEIPNYFKLALKIHFTKFFPMKFITGKGILSYAFIRSIYYGKNNKIEEYISQRNPEYLRWSIDQILHWKPTISCKNLYHIHGTKDIVFPQKRIKKAFLIENANHLLVLQMPKKVNSFLADILLNKKK